MASNDVWTQILRVAAGEVAASGFAQITPAHMLIALSRFSEEEAESGNEDYGAGLRSEFELLGIESRRFRRRLRALLPKGEGISQDSILHRSESTKAAFALSKALADTAAEPSGPAHLLRAIFLLLADVAPPNKMGPAGRENAHPPEDEIPHEL